MRYPILFAALILCAIHPAYAADEKSGAHAIANAMNDYCLTAIKSGQNPIERAVEKNLIEFPLEQAAKFAPDGGAVFMIPEAAGNAVLVTNKNYKDVCNIAVRETKSGDLWNAIDNILDSKSGFTLLREKRIEYDHTTKKEFEGDFGFPIAILITASDTPRPNAMQALITVARVKE